MAECFTFLEDWHGWGGGLMMACGGMADAMVMPSAAPGGPRHRLSMQGVYFSSVEDKRADECEAPLPPEFCDAVPAEVDEASGAILGIADPSASSTT